MTAKLNARQRLIAHVLEHGWVNDPTATRFRGSVWSTKTERDPNVFLRQAAHGGTWRLKLEYGKSASVTLQKAEIAWTPTVLGDIVDGSVERAEYERRTWELSGKPRASWRSVSYLWTALETADDDAKDRTLRQRVELLVTDPDTAVWLAIQVAYDQKVHYIESAARGEVLAERRARPLPLVEGAGSWWSAAFDLQRAAERLTKADGTSDITALLVDLDEKTMALRELVDYRAAKERAELIASEAKL